MQRCAVGACLRISLMLSTSVSVCLSVCLSVCQSVCLSTCLSACLSVCLPICLSVYLSVCLSTYLEFNHQEYLTHCLETRTQEFPCRTDGYQLLVSFSRLRLSYTSRLELSVGNEILRPSEDRRIVSNIPLRDRMVGGGNGNSRFVS